MADTLARPPVAFERILAKRALLSALGPLAGLRAEGTVTATAIGGDVVLPPFTYGIPIIGGKAVLARAVKVLPSGTDARGQPLGHTITSAGVDVPVREGSFLRFDPGTTRVPVAGPDGMTMIGIGARRGSYEPRGPF